MKEYCVVLTTLGSEADAEMLISAVLEDKLAACIQTTNIASHYTWKGRCVTTTRFWCYLRPRSRYTTLWKRKLHPYETPEIIALDIKKGCKGYLDWIDEVTS